MTNHNLECDTRIINLKKSSITDGFGVSRSSKGPAFRGSGRHYSRGFKAMYIGLLKLVSNQFLTLVCLSDCFMSLKLQSIRGLNILTRPMQNHDRCCAHARAFRIQNFRAQRVIALLLNPKNLGKKSPASLAESRR